MKTSFWIQRWKESDIGFHEKEANPLLIKHFQRLNLKKGKRIFIPLCGKTLDIFWLLSNNYQVVGVEFSRIAVKQLFEELNIKPNISKMGKLEIFQSDNIMIFVGDFFNLSIKTLGPVDAVYDRASLVALPINTRRKYTAHLIKISRNAPQLLICYDYDQKLMEGPPFSIVSNEVKQHYQNNYELTLVESGLVDGGLKGINEVVESLWLLQTMVNYNT